MPDELPDIGITSHNYLYDENGAVFAEVWEQEVGNKLQKVNQISTFATRPPHRHRDKRYDHNSSTFVAPLAPLCQVTAAVGTHNSWSKASNSTTSLPTRTEKPPHARKARELKLARTDHLFKDEILLTYFQHGRIPVPTSMAHRQRHNISLIVMPATSPWPSRQHS